MKKIKMIMCVVVATLFLNACTTTKSTTASDNRDGQREILVQNPLSLADMLVRVSGVFVNERGGGTTVTVRGGAPLYVIDGVRIGRSYYSAANAVNVNDIASVEVLKSPSETILYGREAAYGVVVIRTKNGA